MPMLAAGHAPARIRNHRRLLAGALPIICIMYVWCTYVSLLRDEGQVPTHWRRQPNGASNRTCTGTYSQSPSTASRYIGTAFATCTYGTHMYCYRVTRGKFRRIDAAAGHAPARILNPRRLLAGALATICNMYVRYTYETLLRDKGQAPTHCRRQPNMHRHVFPIAADC